MRFRTALLALALSCGVVHLAEAKKTTAVHRVKKNKGAARVNGQKVKAHKPSGKMKKASKVSKHRTKHA